MLSRYFRLCLPGLLLAALACATHEPPPRADVPQQTSQRLARVDVRPADLVAGETVYVPIYSHIYWGPAACRST
jgi:hypothetical protein